MPLSIKSLGTPLTDAAQRLLLLGSGELGREVALEANASGAGGNCRRPLS